MDIDKKDIKWSANLEHYFKEMAEKSYCYAYLHKKAEAEFAYKRNFIDLPVIVLSTALGTLSIGGEGLFGKDEQVAGVCVGAGSIFVGILSTIGTYFGFAKRTEAHRISHIQYSKLYRFLQIELSLPVHERMRANDLLKVSRDTYERLAEVAPLIPFKILESFKKKFNENEKYADIAKPSECNGLERVEIYMEEEPIARGTRHTVRSQTMEAVIKETYRPQSGSIRKSFMSPKVVERQETPSPRELSIEVPVEIDLEEGKGTGV